MILEISMLKKVINIFSLLLILIFFCSAVINISAQDKDDKKKDGVESIGGKEHETNIYGVEIGMDVPTALEAVFVNANRKPGQEKPDAMRKEGKDEKDIRILYKDLPKGELQIVFAEGKYVSQIILNYARAIQYSDLRLQYSGDVREGLGGQRYDDRYSIGYTDSQKVQGIWWRDEKKEGDYKIRLTFTSSSTITDSQFGYQKIIQKSITVKPGDEKKFFKAMEKQAK